MCKDNIYHMTMSCFNNIRRVTFTGQQIRKFSSKKDKVVIKDQLIESNPVSEGKKVENIKIYNPNEPTYQDRIGNAYANYLRLVQNKDYTYKNVGTGTYKVKKSKYSKYYSKNKSDDEWLRDRALENAFKN